MSLNTWKMINDAVVIYNPKTGEPTPLIHSVIVKSDLSYKYWDYLAWSAASINNSDVLALGYGAGTFAQLLHKWGITTKGIGIEIDESLKELHSLFNDYKVHYCDFRDGVKKLNTKFDTILIDVYDEKGYVDDAYDTEWIKIFLSLRKEKGRLVFHCMDLTGSFLAAGIPLLLIPSVLSTMLKRIRAVTNENIYVVPLWSSYLLWIGEPPQKIKSSILPVQWVDLFFHSRMMPIETIDVNKLEAFSRPWTYERLEENNKSLLFELNRRAPFLLSKFNHLVQIMEPALQRNSTVQELETIIKTLSSSISENDDVSSNHALSFLYAMIRNWSEAFRVLSKQKLEFPGWFFE